MKNNKLCLIAATITAISMSLQICSSNVSAVPNETNSDYIAEFSSFPKYAVEIVSEYGGKYPDKYYEICDTVHNLLNNESYIAEYDYNAENAIETMKRTLDVAMGTFPVPYGADYHGMFYADYTVPIIEQATTIYCGPAAILQTVIGNGILSNISSNKNKAAQDIEAEAMGTNVKGKTQTFQVVKRLNDEYYNDSPVYKHINVTKNMTSGNVVSCMMVSFTQNRCPMVCFENTAGLNYYGGKSYGHWVTVSAIDDIRKTVTLVDPHYDSKYRGVHTVTYDELMAALGTIDGWVVY